MDEGIDRPVPGADGLARLAIKYDGRSTLHLTALADMVDELVFGDIERAGNVDELAEEGLADFIEGKFAAEFVGEVVDAFADLRVHGLGQIEAVLAVEHIGNAAFARLGIDADDRLVRAADVLRVDGEIGHAPWDLGIFCNFARASVEAFFDRVLMRAGERGEYQLAGIGLTLRHGQARDPLIDGADRRKVREIQPGGDAVTVHVESDRDDIEVAGAFAIAEERAFDAVRAGHQAKLGGGDAGAAVIVRVQRDDHRVPARQVAAHPFDHVGMDVGSGPLDGVRQVDDHFFLRCRLPDVDHARAAFECEVEFGVGERFGRVLQDHLGVWNGRDEFLHEARAFEGDVADRFAGGIAEGHAALQW